MVKAYAEAGVPECWLVAAKRKEIECYTEPTAGSCAKCRVFGQGDELQSEPLPNVRVPLNRLFG
jgi:Uma2 family endonuclease